MAAKLFFYPGRSAINLNGFVAPGAQITFYDTKTTTKRAVYADSAFSVELANPVVANSAGRFPDIYINDAYVYRIVGTIPSTGESLFDVDPYYAGSIAEASQEILDSVATVTALAVQEGYYSTIAAGAAATVAPKTFISNETGSLNLYSENGTLIATGIAGTGASSGNNITIPRTTTSLVGVIFKGVDRYLHDYPGTDVAQCQFEGVRAGNFTHTSLISMGYGYESLRDLTSGQLNVMFGPRTGSRITTGGVNTGVGVDALGTCTTGGYNDAFGCKALANLTTGFRNKAFGQSCFLRITTGNDNVGMGQETGINLLTGTNNVVIGSFALLSAQTTSNSVVVGAVSSYYFTGAVITTIGKGSFFNCTTGEDNVGLGYEVGYNTSTGGFNVLVGNYNLYNNTVGTHNVAVGHRAGYGAAGNEGSVVDTYCTFVGRHASRDSAIPTATVLTNMTVLGNDAKGSASNQVTLGNAAVTAFRVPGVSMTVSATDITVGSVFNASTTNLILSKTSTAVATTGAQTINKPAGSVNFAAAATSLVVTNALVTANSVIIATVNTNDGTMKSVSAVAAAGSFTLHANAAATAETRVSFIVIN